MSKVAIVRVRGVINLRHDVKQTLELLRLMNKNYCVFLEKTAQNMGMVKRAKDYITWGEAGEDLFEEVVKKRGEEYEGRTQDSKGKISYSRKYHEVGGKKIKKYFRLSPPRGGYGRAGIKKPFSKGGALGDRKEKIADLIRRMI